MTSIIRKAIGVYASIPQPVKKFLLRSLLLFIIWKGIYLAFFAFPRTLDKPLTNLVGKHSAWLLNYLNSSNHYTANEMIAVTQFEGQIQIAPVSRIDLNGKKIMFIADGCNGLELFILYVGFILAMPSKAKRKFFFIPLGLIVIHCINTLRCVGLSTLVVHWKAYFDLAHHYIFKMVVYATIFLLWVKFSEGISFKKELDHVV